MAKKTEDRIQRVELNTHYSHPIHCPFCGVKAFDPEAGADDGEEFTPCPHALFYAHDEGFVYRAPRFDAAVGIAGVADDDIDLPDGGYDGLTDRVALPDAVKFAAYVGAPSFFGAYIGFAPVGETPEGG